MCLYYKSAKCNAGHGLQLATAVGANHCVRRRHEPQAEAQLCYLLTQEI